MITQIRIFYLNLGTFKGIRIYIYIKKHYILTLNALNQYSHKMFTVEDKVFH